MRRNSDLVRDFHQTVGEPPPTVPTLPDSRVLVLRRALISEEYREAMEAFEQTLATSEHGNVDLASLAHELVDLLYVTYGSLIACGIDPDEAFAEVHRANMDKVSGPKRGDGKQMRPPNWKPADVEAVLARQLMRNKEPGDRGT